MLCYVMLCYVMLCFIIIFDQCSLIFFVQMPDDRLSVLQRHFSLSNIENFFSFVPSEKLQNTRLYTAMM